MELPFDGFAPRPGVTLCTLSCASATVVQKGSDEELAPNGDSNIASLFEGAVISAQDARSRSQEWHVVASATDGHVYSLTVSGHMLAVDNLLSI
eukprot:4690208-Pleurochrysis_carterae.AAC.1